MRRGKAVMSEVMSANSNGTLHVAQRGQDASLVLLPKHKIFLSHSSAQKPFVEQLCVDLEYSGYSPFFDQRPDSLPKGETFPDLLFEAAKQCLVAVVILSREYLTSKWPMLELVAFTEAQRSTNPKLKILPLFYKLSVSDLNDQQVHNEMMNLAWSLASSDPRIDPNQWEHALKILARTNGEDYNNFGRSEVFYRSTIVANICRICKPNVMFDLSDMEGRDRMCNILANEFEEQIQPNDYQPLILGMYGMGGTGKTFLCMALCNRFHADYSGHVCYVEIQSGQGVLKLQKQILKKLTNASKRLLQNITTIQEANGCLHEKMPRVDVFLAVDNVHDGDEHLLDAIKVLFKVLSPRSKAIVTSRSKQVLGRIIPSNQTSCLPIPALEKEEAINIFLNCALPSCSLPSLTNAEVQVLEGCVHLCMFLHDDMIQERYHPLALKALGSYCSGLDPKELANCGEKFKSLNDVSDTVYKDHIFKILKTGIDALQPHQRLLFFDVAIFAPQDLLKKINNLCYWLEAMHNLSREEVMRELKNLNMKALIQEVIHHIFDKVFHYVFVHNLYKELAEHEIKKIAYTSRWCVYQRGGKDKVPWCFESEPEGSHWQNLVRMKLHMPHLIKLRKEKIQQWINLQALYLHTDMLEHLDIEQLKHLRSLEVFSLNLKTLLGTKNMDELRYVDLKCPTLKIDEVRFNNCPKLEVFYLKGVNCPTKSSQTLRACRFILMKSKLGGKWIMKKKRQCIIKPRQFIPNIPQKMLDLRNSCFITSLVIVGNMSINMSLKERWKFGIAGLDFLTTLRQLRLINLPIRSLPGLEKLISLETLQLRRCVHYELVLPNLSQCSNIKYLSVFRSRISKIPGLNKMKNLISLYVEACEELVALPDLRRLESLDLIVSSLDPRSILAPKDCWQTTYDKLHDYLITLVRESRPEMSITSLSHLSEEDLYEAMPPSQLIWDQQNFGLESTWRKYNLFASIDA